ncbi:MAG: metallophosphoesterase [Kiritimatiellae bacterium]|nr:metallophosphoesterase [Kiritimatiellia bacterium]
MKFLITADLHYDVRRSKKAAESLARRVCETSADALVLVGDTAGADLDVFRAGLGLFDGFAGKKLLVPGNHCLWCHGEETSIQRYETLLPAVAAEEGFAVLDHQPVQLGVTALVGSVGWYDYSLRDESLGIPLEFYREKLSPGAARYYGGYDALLEKYADVLGERQLSLGARWMDGWRCRLGMSDEEFLQRLLHTLESQLTAASLAAQRIVVFLHHLPFGELVPRNRPDKFAFAAAYMGSENMGLLLKRFDKITDVYCAHSHWPSRGCVGNMNVVNVGSTYLHKNLEELDVL